MLDGNYTRTLRAVLNKSRRQHSTKQQLYCHLPPITITIQIIWHVGHCWRNWDELINDILQCTLRRNEQRLDIHRTYVQLLCVDTGCSLEDFPEAMGGRDGWREREIHAKGATWWWYTWGDQISIMTIPFVLHPLLWISWVTTIIRQKLTLYIQNV